MTIIMGPGERVEVLVQAGPAGSYALRTLANATGFTTQAGQVLATMVSAGAASTPQPLPTTLMPLEDLSTLSADEIDGHRQITFQIKPPINPRASRPRSTARSLTPIATIRSSASTRLRSG